MIAPVGSTPLPVAPAISVPTIAPVTPPAPARDPGGSTGREDRRQDGPPLYDRKGVVTGGRKGAVVNRKA